MKPTPTPLKQDEKCGCEEYNTRGPHTHSSKPNCICGCHTEKYQSAPLDIKMKPIGCQHCTPPSSPLEGWEKRFDKEFPDLYDKKSEHKAGRWVKQFISEVIAEVRAEERESVKGFIEDNVHIEAVKNEAGETIPKRSIYVDELEVALSKNL